jgi:predicted nucleic acid-binding protein
VKGTKPFWVFAPFHAIRVPTTREAVLAAAHIKANYPVAYTDAFAIAAAQELRGKVLTGEPEFEAIESIVPVEWLNKQA